MNPSPSVPARDSETSLSEPTTDTGAQKGSTVEATTGPGAAKQEGSVEATTCPGAAKQKKFNLPPPPPGASPEMSQYQTPKLPTGSRGNAPRVAASSAKPVPTTSNIAIPYEAGLNRIEEQDMPSASRQFEFSGYYKALYGSGHPNEEKIARVRASAMKESNIPRVMDRPMPKSHRGNYIRTSDPSPPPREPQQPSPSSPPSRPKPSSI